MKKYKSLEELFKELGFSESSGRYNIVNSAGYLGKYQMGGSALTDAGYYKLNPNGKENDWLGTFTGKDNVNSKEDFLNNPYAQENAIREFTKKQWGYLKNNGSTKNRRFLKKETKRKRTYTRTIGRALLRIIPHCFKMGNGKQSAGYRYACKSCGIL